MAALDSTVRLAREILPRKNGGEILIEGLSYPTVTQADPSNPFELKHSVLQAAVDALESEQTWAVSNGLRVIREYFDSVDEVCDPDTVIEKVRGCVSAREIAVGSEAALALGFLLNTRPSESDLPTWNFADGVSAEGELTPVRVGFEPPMERGYINEISGGTVSKAIETLESNLERKQYKRSAQWRVGGNCAFALGLIGYRRPELVESSVEPLSRVQVPRYHKLGPAVFALSSIGYMRPDFLPPDVRRALWDLPDEFPAARRSPNYTAVRMKLGRAPEWLAVVGAYSEDLLRESIERLLPFLFGRHVAYYPPVETQ